MAGDGGQAMVDNYANICTGSCNGSAVPTSSAGGAFGILAQSVGGGLGRFGLAASAGEVGVSFALGGSGGSDGDLVYVVNTASIPRWR